MNSSRSSNDTTPTTILRRLERRFGVRTAPPPAGIAGGLRGPWVILRARPACAARLGGAALATETDAPGTVGTGTALGAVDFGVGVTQARADFIDFELDNGALLAFLGFI
jgi:hypothetical protein